MQHIQVTDVEPIQISSKDDGTLTLSALAAHYPGATGLKYRLDGHIRTVKLSNGILYPPENDWGDNIYYCIFPKDHIKRKADNILETSESKTSKVDAELKKASVVLDSFLKTTHEELRDNYPKFGELPNAQNFRITPKNMEPYDDNHVLDEFILPYSVFDEPKSTKDNLSEISVNVRSNDNDENSEVVTQKDMESYDDNHVLVGLSMADVIGTSEQKRTVPLFANDEISMKLFRNRSNNQLCVSLSKKNDGKLPSEKDLIFSLLKKWLQYKFRCPVYVEVFSDTLRELSFIHLENNYRVTMSFGDVITLVNESLQKVKIMWKKELPVLKMKNDHILIENEEEEKEVLSAFFKELED